MNRKNIGNVAREPTPNSEPVASNGGFVGFAAPTGPGSYPANRLQYPNTTGYNVNIGAHSHGMMPSSQNGSATASQFTTRNITTAGRHNLNMQPFLQSHSDTQNYPIFQNQTHFHNVGVMVASPATGVPNNGHPRTRGQHQMFGNPNSAPLARQGMPSASASVMTQLPQPAAPQKSDDELDMEVKDLLEEKGMKFGGHIRNFRLAARYREAEKRVKVAPTPKLAKDFPTSEIQQVALAKRIWDALASWAIHDQPGGSKMAIKRLKSITSITAENVAWDIMVFKTKGPLGVDTS